MRKPQISQVLISTTLASLVVVHPANADWTPSPEEPSSLNANLSSAPDYSAEDTKVEFPKGDVLKTGTELYLAFRNWKSEAVPNAPIEPAQNPQSPITPKNIPVNPPFLQGGTGLAAAGTRLNQGGGNQPRVVITPNNSTGMMNQGFQSNPINSAASTGFWNRLAQAGRQASDPIALSDNVFSAFNLKASNKISTDLNLSINFRANVTEFDKFFVYAGILAQNSADQASKTKTPAFAKSNFPVEMNYFSGSAALKSQKRVFGKPLPVSTPAFEDLNSHEISVPIATLSNKLAGFEITDKPELHVRYADKEAQTKRIFLPEGTQVHMEIRTIPNTTNTPGLYIQLKPPAFGFLNEAFNIVNEKGETLSKKISSDDWDKMNQKLAKKPYELDASSHENIAKVLALQAALKDKEFSPRSLDLSDRFDNEGKLLRSVNITSSRPIASADTSKPIHFAVLDNSELSGVRHVFADSIASIPRGTPTNAVDFSDLTAMKDYLQKIRASNAPVQPRSDASSSEFIRSILPKKELCIPSEKHA